MVLTLLRLRVEDWWILVRRRSVLGPMLRSHLFELSESVDATCPGRGIKSVIGVFFPTSLLNVAIEATPRQGGVGPRPRPGLGLALTPTFEEQEDSCKQIMDAARTTNAKTMHPVPSPTKKRIYCVLKSPHVHKDARFHFEIRTHQHLIDILYPTAQTIDFLMQLDLPARVDVEVKL
ncbi:hypothetical protein HYC85_015084 [Camellia sinensis]|uniref:Small ribosomal subunit protein uS10 domain-containing protein n=1 Tax=Camellia sinensis TaxID=4442 RepID=A0A7J7H9B5_CAMSI|nr:hypothetical protein HYC85_015084 [Camellia sinensis]